MSRARRNLTLFFVVLMLAFALPASAATPAPEESFDRGITFDPKLHQQLADVAMGKVDADLIIQGVTLLNVFTVSWMPVSDVVIYSGHVAWIGPSGKWTGKAAETVNAAGLYAVPGFIEPHKHIESSHLTPDREAEVVLADGVTTIFEASHEFSNVRGEPQNSEFWQAAWEAGSPLKIWVLPGSATPPTGFEFTGGNHTGAVMATAMKNPWVAGTDEVMSRPAWDNPLIPGYNQMWDLISVTKLAGKLLEGHGSGTTDLAGINEFAAAGLTSDHEVKGGQEVWDKLQRGIFIEMRPASAPTVIPYLIMNGLTNWSNMSVTTDDRSVETSLKLGTMDYNIREAIKAGVPPVWAYVMGSYNTARHYRLDEQIGSVAPGRFADIVLLRDPVTVEIAQVYANGELVAENGKTVAKIPTVTWPKWATETMNVGRQVTAADFVVASPNKTARSVTAYTLKPFYFLPDPMTATLQVKDGEVQRDSEQSITKFCIVDRYNAQDQPVACMFWQGVGPKTADTAVCSSVAHDHHNIWVMGSSDEPMAQCVNSLAKIGGGWTLVSGGKVLDEVVFEVGGLMSARSPQVVADDLTDFWTVVSTLEWIGITASPDDIPAYSAAIQSSVYRQIFATLTCTPWKWVLVAPFAGCPSGFVNVTNGECRPVIK